MNKYLPYIFKNGRVVMVSEKDIDEAIKQNKEILIFCGAWSGGYAKAIGGEKTTYDGQPCIQMYAYDINEQIFTTEEMMKFYKVIVSPGIRVYMQSGEPASDYTDRFVDNESTYEQFKQRYDYAGQSEQEFHRLRKSVNQKMTLAMMNIKERDAHWAALNSMATFHIT